MNIDVFNRAINKGLTVKFYGKKVVKYINHKNEKGRITGTSLIGEDGKEIKEDNNQKIDFLDRFKFYNKDGKEVEEPKVYHTVNVIYGPSF